MKIDNSELTSILSSFNPWWQNGPITGLPSWHRSAFQEFYQWVSDPPVSRAVLLSGARQVGKTTLLLQAIDRLLKQNVPKTNIIYVTFDHPIIKLVGIDKVLEAWRQSEPAVSGLEYLFLDEAQFIPSVGTWVKHQVDFFKNRRIFFTGSAMPLIEKGQESGVGRWYTIRLATLSFYECLQLKKSELLELKNFKFKEKNFKFEGENEELLLNAFIRQLKNIKIYPNLPEIPEIKDLSELFQWQPQEFQRIGQLFTPYIGHFHQYLVRGGFPQTAKIESISEVQRLLREDIIDKVLKRDMTAIFGVRRILELERTFLYLCMNNSGTLDMKALCSNLEVNRQTAERFIYLLEAAHLIYKLPPFSGGKEVLRGKYKIYLADAAIAPAVLLKGKSIIDDSGALGKAVETTVYKHLLIRYAQNFRFTYWRESENDETDLILECGDQILPFEVKYREKNSGIKELKGLLQFCEKKAIKQAFVSTKSIDDFGVYQSKKLNNLQILRIPSALLCYWLGQSETNRNSSA